jgi:hypothetical protein
MRWRCGDCKASLYTHRPAPMLHDDIWRAMARDRAQLCDACLRMRMQRVLGRELRFGDLICCMFNVMTGHFAELAPHEFDSDDS